ncbi:MAG: VTT domain-containing protein [Rothia sp. (in: high G+C Gram-positive bacteria)]|uniref:DedA family protein n=1 Tax=Rothia sp. (in: high G+C Gram-positive bacteria) TaxID=1885016 RepID=UPI0026E04D21|nr:VTT domain-containing protein [Rothia sp. (in: high G+C Gram-positive bacteria)]MDO5749762.1 VTT domain-containing protein [Rothia sp. (in: high G+C Gram-positive bacteria)]
MSFLMTNFALHIPVALLGLDLEQILLNAGGWVVALASVIVFIESGVLFPVLPGDSLIFAIGMLHTQMGIPLWIFLPVLIIAAIAGAEVGYQLGARYGRKLFKDDARFLSTKNLHAAEEFFAKRGGLALVLGRFIPIVRTFVSLAAGISSYKRSSFHLWNVVGACVWILSIGFAGVMLGGVPFIKNNIELIAIIIVLVSVIPVGLEYLRARREAKQESAE